MQDRQVQRRILLLLSDRWAELKSFIFDLKLGQLWVTVGASHLDAVSAFDFRLRHVGGNCVIAIAGQAIDAGSYEEMSADLPSRAKQLVNVALPVADVNASLGLAEEFGRLSQRMLSFFSMGTRVGFTLLLSAAVPLNFFRFQNLTAVRPSGRPSVVTAKLECIRMPQTV
jgi:hypothetical protein